MAKPDLYDFHHLRHMKEQSRSRTTLRITLALTIFFTLVEISGGLYTHSLALLSDSAHMVSDVLALGFSMFALYLATKPSNAKYTFGYLRFEIIASSLNGLALVVIALGIFIEGINRIVHPEPVLYLPVMLTIAIIGFLVNLTLTVVLSRSMKEERNLNVQSALWHFFGDLLSSVGVIISAVLIYTTGFVQADPLISLVIGGIIFFGGSKIIRESYLILMESVPEKFNLDTIRKDIAAVEGVENVHEMHLWAISTDHFSLTAHVFINNKIQPFCIILAINETLKEKYGIVHSTIQMEEAHIHNHGEFGKQFLRNQEEKMTHETI